MAVTGIEPVPFVFLVVGTSLIDNSDNYCFGTGLPISMHKDIYQYQNFE